MMAQNCGQRARQPPGLGSTGGPNLVAADDGDDGSSWFIAFAAFGRDVIDSSVSSVTVFIQFSIVSAGPCPDPAT